MAIISIGSNENTQHKTPTLKQFIKSGQVIPNKEYPVTLIFTPGSYPTLTLVCGDEFKVTMSNRSSLAQSLLDNIPQYQDNHVRLVVLITSLEEESFVVGEDTDLQAEWTSRPWGYFVDELPAIATLREPKQNSPTTEVGGMQLELELDVPTVDPRSLPKARKGTAK